jgi:ADP-heptose:LPS heptosyltransferase
VSGSALLYCAGGGIGDSLVASVVARALHASFSRVDALTLPGHRSTLERCADIDAVYVDDGEAVDDLAASIHERGYDACVVTWATSRVAQIAHRAKIPVRVGQARRLYSHLFTHRVVVRSELGDVTSRWVDILLDYARALDCDTADTIPSFVPTASDVGEVDALRSAQSLPKGEYLIVHPTNAVATQRKIWPTKGWSALARALGTRFDLPVLLSGAPADRSITAAIASESSAISIAGALGIGGFGALAAAAKAFVGITTGSMHVAAAVGAPTLGIFPFQSDFPERWAPIGQRTGVARATYACHPGDSKENCADYACIANLDVPRIVAAVSALLA